MATSDLKHVKFEPSPDCSLAVSFDSSDSIAYSSLFSDHSDSLNALDASDVDDVLESSRLGSSEAPDNEKRSVKKRKSWGQQLPEPKTNLPPRKRAKTEDEKEQRRVERVLRNRRAAQSSRERKRQEVEALEAEKREIERRNRDLELRLAHSEAMNAQLQQHISQMTGGLKPFPADDESASGHSSPITLSQDLFAPRDQQTSTFESVVPAVPITSAVHTVDPASLTPVALDVDDSFNVCPSDMTQHPAAVLCDLQCQSEGRGPWTTSSSPSTAFRALLLTLISTSLSLRILSPLMEVLASLSTSSALSPTPSILAAIIWLTTTPVRLTLTTSSSPNPRVTSSRFSLRLGLLRRLLASSPQLARPLMDATMGAMRQLQSERMTTSRDCLDGGILGTSGGGSTENRHSPRWECLMTLLWTIKVFDNRQRRDESSGKPLGTQGIRRASLCESSSLHPGVQVDEAYDG